MKILLVFIALFGLTLAVFPEVSSSFDPEYRNNFLGDHLKQFKSFQISHYVQHEDTVAQAKSRVQEKLNQLNRAHDGGASGRTYSSGGYTSGSSGGNYRYNSGCTYCDQSSASSNLDQSSSFSSRSGLSNSDYSGVGTVGHSNLGESSQYTALKDDVQTPVPSRTANSRTSASSKYSESFDAEDVQQRVQPEYPVMGRDQQAYTGASFTSSHRNFGSAVPSHSDIDVSHHSSAANSELTEGSTYTQRRPVYTSGHSQQQQVQRGQSSTSDTRSNPVITIPLRITPVSNGQQYTSSRSDYEEASSSSRTQPTYSVVYRPVPYTGDQQGRLNYRDRSNSGITTSTIYVPQTVQVNSEKYIRPNEPDLDLQTAVKPELTNYNSFDNSERSESSRTNYRASVEPGINHVYTPSRPADGGSSRFASNVNSNVNNNRQTVYVRPNEHEETSSTTRQDSNYRQTSRINTNSDQEARSQYGSYYDNPSPSSSTNTQQRISSGSQTSRVANRYNQLPTQLYPTGDRLSTRLGTGTHDSQGSLDEFMTESERLAKLQSRTVAGSSAITHSNSNQNVDAYNRIAIDKANSLDSNAAEYLNRSSLNTNQQTSDTALPPGYKKVTSWQKQSKWASGSKYGADGKLSTHSMLSTAEGEQHNINGDQVGFKAATTTLEDDGKVSTYSLHS